MSAALSRCFLRNISSKESHCFCCSYQARRFQKLSKAFHCYWSLFGNLSWLHHHLFLSFVIFWRISNFFDNFLIIKQLWNGSLHLSRHNLTNVLVLWSQFSEPSCILLKRFKIDSNTIFHYFCNSFICVTWKGWPNKEKPWNRLRFTESSRTRVG